MWNTSHSGRQNGWNGPFRHTNYFAQQVKKGADSVPKDEQKLAISEKQMEMIQEIAENISYGTVTLVFQDGVLVQIDRNEKIRLPREPKRTNH